MSLFTKLALLIAVVAAGLRAGGAEEAQPTLRLARIFGDHVVLQQEKPIRVWGWAKPGAKVTVTLTESRDEAAKLAGEDALQRRAPALPPEDAGRPLVRVRYTEEGAPAFQTLSAEATAGVDGAWAVALPAQKASFTPKYLLAVSGGERVALVDVLIGEVWLTSGQSNMARGLNDDQDWLLEKDSADFPGIRYCRVDQESPEPQADLSRQAEWRVLAYHQGDLGSVSAVSYWFAARLHRYLKVPVGIYCAAIGGTLAEQWAPRKDLEALPQLKEFLATYPNAGSCYNAMIAPAGRFAFRGALFYQGENNSIGKWTIYQYSFPQVIKSWRQTFGDANLPFGIISLAGFGPYGADQDPATTDLPPGMFWYAAIRDVHFRTAKALPNTGLITTWDVGDTANIHPHRKGAVGERAARWALACVYGKPVLYTAPVFREAKVEGSRMKLYFDLDPMIEKERAAKRPTKPVAWLDYPFTCEGNEYRGFVIAGEDRHFYPAHVQRSKEACCLEVWSDLVPKPTAVRFGWSGMPDANVIGMDHLPVHPFRTDDWPLLADPPYDNKSPERKAWDEALNAKKQEAQRLAWERKLEETRLMLDDLQRSAGKLAGDDARAAWEEKTKQAKQTLTELEELCKKAGGK